MARDRFEKGDRVMRLLREQQQFLLVPQGLSTRELAQRMGISQRQAQRDINALESELGMPFVQQGKRYSVIEGYWLPPVNFTLQEAMGLLLSARLMARYADRSNPFVAAAYEKIATVLPKAVRGAVADAADELTAGRRVDEVYVKVFGALTAAWAERRKVRITYTMDRTFSRVVWPLSIEPTISGHACYLVAWEEKRQVPRSYKLERISAVEVLEPRFDPPLGFSVAAMLAHAWGIWSGERPIEVELVFSAAVARRVCETTWHPSQSVSPLADGRVRVTLLVSSTLELKPWVLGWGRECEVVRPAAFRDEVAGELIRAATAYAAE